MFNEIINVVIKGTIMQIEKALINDDRLLVSKASWKFCIPTFYNFTVISPWIVAYFLTISMVFSVCKKSLRLNNLKTRTAMNVKISVFAICVEPIVYLLLHNWSNWKLILIACTKIFNTLNYNRCKMFTVEDKTF